MNMPTRSTIPTLSVHLFEEEGTDLFDVRPAILGHLQQGGNPSPFDRIQATRFADLSAAILMIETAEVWRKERLHRHAER
jgi:6-phosphofructokinase